MMTEQWRPVVGFEGAYEVSNRGRVKSVDRYTPCRDKKGSMRFCKGKILSPTDDGRGYKQVSLRGASIGVKSKVAKIYRLVAEAFIGAPPTPLHVANHINGTKTDDYPENLEWITQAENMAHAGRTGLMARGVAKKASKTTDDEVRQMREMRQQGIRLRVIAEKFGMSIPTVCQIVNGTWWKHAPLADYVPPPATEWIRGENAHDAKLTENNVREIRRLYATGKYTQQQIGEMFGVTNVSISSVIIRKTWAHVTEAE